MPAFGFSVGDFVAVASLIWRLTQALDEASDDSKLFREIQLELSAFRDVIVQFQNAMATGAAPSKEQVDRTRTVLSHIERVVKQLMQHTEKFKGAGPADKDGTKVITGWRKKVQWSFFGKKQIQQFREGLRSYAAVLMLIMQSLNSKAMQDLQQQMATGTQNLNQQMLANTVLIRSLQEPWDQKPIRFQDAIGRRFPVPLEVAERYEDFIDFLSHAFKHKNSAIQRAIQHQSIWLFSPVVGKTKTWNIITGEDWASCVRPGMQLSMSVDKCQPPVSYPEFTCVMCCMEDVKVKIRTPLPIWAAAFYPEDALFNLVISKRRATSAWATSTGVLPLCGHLIGTKSMQEVKVLGTELPSFACPNKIGCGKSFASQEELKDHLKPVFFEPDSLKPFLVEGYLDNPYGPQCLSCGYGNESLYTREETKSIQAAFAEAIDMQQKLTGDRHGFGWCIADYVTRGDLDTPLYCCGCGSISIGPVGRQTSVLDLAAAEGNQDLVEVIMQHCTDLADEELKHGSALMRAAKSGHGAIVKMLLDKGVDLNGYYSRTAMTKASAGGHKVVVELLLANGAAVDIPSDLLQPLVAAACEGHVGIVTLLLDSGADIDGRSGHDKPTALWEAVENGYEEVVDILLRRGANANLQMSTRTCRTVLNLAARYGNRKIVEMLLDSGADIDARDCKGRSATDHAEQWGNQETMQLLLDRGAPAQPKPNA